MKSSPANTHNSELIAGEPGDRASVSQNVLSVDSTSGKADVLES